MKKNWIRRFCKEKKGSRTGSSGGFGETELDNNAD